MNSSEAPSSPEASSWGVPRLVAMLVGPLPEDPEARRRATLTVAISVAIVLAAIPLMIKRVAQTGMVGPTAASFALGIPLMASNVLLLRRGWPTRRVGALVSLELFVVVLAITVDNGGLRSAAVYWTLTVPMIACLQVGMRFGMAMLGLTILELVVLQAIRVSGLALPVHLTMEQTNRWQVVCLASVAVFLTAVTWSYERGRRRAQQQIVRMQRDLVDLAREAGQADVAVNVLHEVGNALNGVTTSAGLLERSLRGAATGRIERLAAMLQGDEPVAHGDEERRARLAARYARAVAEQLAVEQLARLDELARLQRFARDAVGVVRRQECFSGGNHTTMQRLCVRGALEAGIAAAEAGHEQQTRLWCPSDLATRSDRLRVARILSTLVRNAHRAMDDVGAPEPVEVAATTEGEHVVVSVVDRGRPLDDEALVAAFRPDVSSRSAAGLHRAANTATELGGALTAVRDGEHGMVFRLRLPLVA